MNSKVSIYSIVIFMVMGVFVYYSSGFAGKISDETTLLGKKAPDWTLKDLNGKEISLSNILKKSDVKGVVIEFIATRCPVSKAYDKRIVQLHKEYSEKGIVFIGINANCNPMEPLEEMRTHAENAGITFPILKDDHNAIADQYGARVTPHMYLLDAQGIVRYIGRIDDSQNPDKVKSCDLQNAFDAILSGKEVPVKMTKAFGCTIKRVKL